MRYTNMRFCRTPALIVVFIATFLATMLQASAATPVAPTVAIHIAADRITFYNDQWLLEADGHVRITTSDGLHIRGQAFSMNLKMNRFVVAGRVHVTGTHGAQNGAALADFLDSQRVYFLPLTTEPDRWTFLNGDFRKPIKGRIMPGDPFFLPDLSHAQIDGVAQRAVVVSRQFIRLEHPRIRLLGALVPLPAYYLNFSTNQALAQNSLAGATFDGTLNLAGTTGSISSLHVRYDPQNHAYLSFEQHLASKNAYAVFSLNPGTQPRKFWDLVTGYQPNARFQIRGFSQLHTYQSWLRQPVESSQFTAGQIIQGFSHSSVQANFLYVNDTLIAQPVPGHTTILNHPSAVNLQASSFYQRIGKSPLFEQISYGFGFNHDNFGLQNFGGVNYTTIWSHSLGLSVYVPQIAIGKRNDPAKDYYFNATFSKTRQWFSVPHYTDSAITNLSVSRSFTQSLSAFLAYGVSNTGDYYTQGTGYPSYVPVVGGVSYPGFAAFHGVATARTLSLGATFTHKDDFAATLLLRSHDDFPKPIPNFFGIPPTNILGQFTTGTFLGQPPFDATMDVRMRVARHLIIDVQRSYYSPFSYPNFGMLQWSPQTVVQISQ